MARGTPGRKHLASGSAVARLAKFSRFFAACGRAACEQLGGLHAWALRTLPERAEGYTLDLDSFALVHEDGNQEGVRVGYTRKGLKPCHRPIVAAIAEVPLVANFWLRPGHTACVSAADTFLGDTLARLPPGVRIALVRGDSGLCTEKMLTRLEAENLPYVLAAALRSPVQALCRHDETAWTATEVPGLAAQYTAKYAWPDGFVHYAWFGCVPVDGPGGTGFLSLRLLSRDRNWARAVAVYNPILAAATVPGATGTPAAPGT